MRVRSAISATWWAWSAPALAVAIAGGLAAGRYPLHVKDVAQFALACLQVVDMPQDQWDLLYNVIVQIRLPRVLTAVLVGAALATSGTAYQAVFRNPLVSPELMGVLAGAAFGAALGILLSHHWAVTQTLAFVMGVVAVVFGVSVARLAGGAAITMLVLGGVISGTLFTALLSVAKFVADPYQKLPAIEYWLMGNLALADLHVIGWVALPMAVGIVVLAGLGRALDALAMGDDEARSLGVPVTAVRYGVMAIATLISALTVSLAGMVGWVGLIVPHVARLLVGPGNRRLLPASASLGALFLLLADTIARTAYNVEIPIGILTALIGVPAFLVVLHRARRGWL